LDREIPFSIRSDVALFSGAPAANDHRGTLHQRSSGVAYGAGDRSGIGCLAVDRQSAESERGSPEQGVGRANRHVAPTTTTAGRQNESGLL
jgi:hypothetical protein